MIIVMLIFLAQYKGNLNWRNLLELKWKLTSTLTKKIFLSIQASFFFARMKF